MPRVTPVLILEILTVLATALAAWRLYANGLHRTYRIFFAYLLFRIPEGLWPIFLDLKSRAYFYFFTIALPIVWILYGLMVLELFGLILERHRGLRTVGRWLLCLALAVTVVVSVVSMLNQIAPQMPQRSVAMAIVVTGERALGFSLAVTLILMVALLNFYTVPLSRNVLVHAGVYTIYFLSGSLSMILRAVFGLKNTAQVDTGTMAVAFLCVLAWALFLTKAGEQTNAKIYRFDADHEERILRTLDTINASLLRAARK